MHRVLSDEKYKPTEMCYMAYQSTRLLLVFSWRWRQTYNMNLLVAWLSTKAVTKARMNLLLLASFPMFACKTFYIQSISIWWGQWLLNNEGIMNSKQIQHLLLHWVNWVFIHECSISLAYYNFNQARRKVRGRIMYSCWQLLLSETTY